jgi:hypothetical protein
VISGYFTRQEFVFIEALPEVERFNSEFITETIPPNLVQSVSLLRPKIAGPTQLAAYRQCQISQFCSVSSQD